MDVREDASVTEAVERILGEAGRLDAVVNSAGIGIAGAIEDTSSNEAMDLFETNFFGTLRVCRAVLPQLRAQGGGTIVNMSSIGGKFGLPFQAMYSASKFALEGLTEALRIEVKPFGIRVVLVEPGDFRTEFTAHRRRVASATPAYQRRFEQALQRAEADEIDGSDPAAVARLVLRVVRHPNPRLRYTVGNPAQRLAANIRGVLPGQLLEWGIIRYYRVR
jgi:NAD(P)-dependent dehydrogenase (short-subunit alcohol dehydrogenase family)